MRTEKVMPAQIANQICRMLIEKHNKKRLSFKKWFCNVCKGRCIHGNEYNRGCWQVNKVYDEGFNGGLNDK